jgi:hypothetical protein
MMAFEIEPCELVMTRIPFVYEYVLSQSKLVFSVATLLSALF